jgi:cell division protein FtsN
MNLSKSIRCDSRPGNLGSLGSDGNRRRCGPARPPRQALRGAFLPGLVAGLLIGLALALGVALYVTKVPVPFVDKVPQRNAETDAEEARRNKDWNPNAALGSKAPRPQAPSPEKEADADTGQATQGATPLPTPATADTASAAPVTPTGPAATAPAAPTRNPAAILAGAPVAPPRPADTVTSTARVTPPAAAGREAFLYFVQAGAFVRLEDAQVQRAKLAMVGQESRVMEREQAGRTVHRVRVGPFDSATQAQAIRDRLAAAGFDVTLVRVERSTP